MRRPKEPTAKTAKFYHPNKVKAQHRGHFFDPGAMAFFRSIIHEVGWTGDGGKHVFFVTSEQFDVGYPRLYTVRVWTKRGDRIDTVGNFRGYETEYEAGIQAKRLAEGA